MLRHVAIEAEERAAQERPAFWSWLRAAAWTESSRRLRPSVAVTEPAAPALSAQDLEAAAGALAGMLDHEERQPDPAAAELAALYETLGADLALMRRNVPAASETRH